MIKVPETPKELELPYESWRPNQKEVIEKIINSNKKIVVLNAPVGTGKSAIAVSLLKLLGSGYIVTKTKALQSQYKKDFPFIEEIKGRNNYDCFFYDRKADKCLDSKVNRIIAETFVSSFSKSNFMRKLKRNFNKLTLEDIEKVFNEIKEIINEYDEDEMKKAIVDRFSHINLCPYLKQREKAIYSRYTIMNYHYFITAMNNPYTPWDSRKIVIFDEAHNLEDVISEFCSLEIDVKKYKELTGFDIVEEIEEIDDKEIDYALSLSSVLESECEFIEQLIKDEEIPHYFELKTLYKEFKKTIELIKSDPYNWSVSFERNEKDEIEKIKIQPIIISKYTYLLMKGGMKYVFMSSTISEQYMKMVLYTSNFDYIELPHMFPKENRKIYLLPVINMRYEDIDDEKLQKMVKYIDKIIDKYPNQRGVIHTSSFSLAKYIIENSKHKKRLISNINLTVEEMLKRHEERTDSIIVSPSVEEGIDLKGDLCRFQIICRLPFPNFGDPIIQERSEIIKNYHEIIMANRLIQMYGRGTRSPDDFSETWILDIRMLRYMKRKYLWPDWFLEAIEIYRR